MKKLVVAWVVTALAATGAAVAVLGLLGNGLTGTDSHVLSREDVREALATATTRAAVTAGATPSQTAQQGKLIRSAGGTVIASCDGDLVTLRSWSPAQGYSVDEVGRGPAREAKVEFEPEEGEELELKITCVGGAPVSRVGG
ncbi:septum formation initiator [Nonomuraea sp. PA05]|uniref:septum formation initiator n=1 Tax=Nonomuraea sp. PA05 TaxID=2604466 RepID=UPI0011D3DD8D|nr:septum formation initiator [Nonomuraea sp. PA05]TYB58603.1 septum formation initiator [Nonomuraea sp. PA05]